MFCFIKPVLGTGPSLFATSFEQSWLNPTKKEHREGWSEENEEEFSPSSGWSEVLSM